MKSVRTKLIIFAAIGLFLTVSVVQVISSTIVGRRIDKQIRNHLSTMTEDNSKIMDEWVLKQKAYLYTIRDDVELAGNDDMEFLYGITGSALNNNPDAMMYYMCFGDTKEIFPADRSTLDLDPTTRGWYTGAIACGDIYITDPYTDYATRKMVVSMAIPATIKGREGVVLADISIDSLVTMVEELSSSPDLEAFLLTSSGDVMVHENEAYLPTEEGSTRITDVCNIDLLSSEVTTFQDYEGDTELCSLSTLSTTGWILGLTESKAATRRDINQSFIISSISSLGAYVIILGILGLIITKMMKPLKEVDVALTKISQGDFDVMISKANGKDEIARLQRTSTKLIETFTEIIQEENRILGSMANYDLSEKDMREYEGEFDRLSSSVNQIKSMLGDLIQEIQMSSVQVGEGSHEIADATDNLSQGTLAQASSIDKVVMDIDDIVHGITENSKQEELVDQQLRHLNTEINHSDAKMTELLDVVKKVGKMSNDISNIVSTIDAIAFQTNILALNASVEAARAGEQGKGFAVVAEEVRNLAAKSAEASAQTAELISSCILEIDRAIVCTEDSFSSMQAIVSNSGEIAVAFNAISEATKIQAEKSNDIKAEIATVADVVQNNTATAEQTAAATVELSEQAESLSQMIRKFKM